MLQFDLTTLINIVLLTLLVVTAIAVMFSGNLLVSTILLSIFSLLMAVQYLVLGAPDVAITEAAVGTGISTILLLIAVLMIGEKAKKVDLSVITPLILVIATAAVLIYVALTLPPVGDSKAPEQVYLAPQYIRDSEHDTGVPNMVTAILASYRGFDTLGETHVIFTAGLAVMLLLARDRRKKKRKQKE